MLYRVRRAAVDAQGGEARFDFTGYTDSFELGHAMNVWFDHNGVVVHMRTGTVRTVEDNSTEQYRRWIATTENGVYDVLMLTQRMVDEIGIKGVIQ